MRKFISKGKIALFLTFAFSLVFITSCKKGNEIATQQKDKVSIRKFDPKTSLSASAYSKFLQDVAKLCPKTITGKEYESQNTGLKIGSGCTPAVSFTHNWDSYYYRYNCSSAHNLCNYAIMPGYDSYIYIGTDYGFQTYWSLSSNGNYTQGIEISFQWQPDNYNIDFKIGNNSPSRYYFVKCLWYNIYYSPYFGYATSDIFYVNSPIAYLIYHNPPPPAFTVSISGPVKGYNNVQYTWHAVPANGTGTITYQWYYSSDQGYTYPYSWGSGQSRTDFLPNDQDLYIEVVATASNGTATADFYTWNLGDHP